MIKFQLLWTDKCFLLLLIVLFVLIWRGLKKRHIRQALSEVFHRPLAIISSVVLSIFLIIAVLDSIHYRQQVTYLGKSHYSMRLTSVLDQLLNPLGKQFEKTYSAPFALHLYTKQMVMTPQGQEQRYPRLKFIDPKIKSIEDRNRLIRSIIVQSVFLSIGMALFLFTFASLFFVFRKRRISVKNISYAFTDKRILLFVTTITVCFFVLYVCYTLSRYFHILGTGKIGQDIFFYAVKSIRTGLIIGTLTTLFMLPFALLLGISAGFFGGLVDDIIQYVYTTLSSIPGVLLIAASILSIQIFISNHPDYFQTLSQRADARLLALCAILGLTSWTSLCRILRAESLKIREIDYIQAATALGTRSHIIITKHILPNVMHIVLISIVLDFSFLVLAEAVLSYVGVGVSPMTISWGNMINGARLELAREPLVWWPMLAAFLFMFILVLASNLFADALRDAFDPRYVEK